MLCPPLPHRCQRPLALGSGEFLLWGFPFAFWMEQQGYDVSYISNVDTHANGPRRLRTKTFISVGYDEIWSLDRFDNVSKGRDKEVNLAFLSGNSV